MGVTCVEINAEMKPNHPEEHFAQTSVSTNTCSDPILDIYDPRFLNETKESALYVDLTATKKDENLVQNVSTKLYTETRLWILSDVDSLKIQDEVGGNVITLKL
jgi:hypothetical protein